MRTKWIYALIGLGVVDLVCVVVLKLKGELFPGVMIGGIFGTIIRYLLLYWLVAKKQRWGFLSFVLVMTWLLNFGALFFQYRPEYLFILFALIPFTIYSIPMIRENFRMDTDKYYTWCLGAALALGCMLGALIPITSFWILLGVVPAAGVGYWITRKASIFFTAPVLGIFVAIAVFVVGLSQGENEELVAIDQELSAKFEPIDFEAACSIESLVSASERDLSRYVAKQNCLALRECLAQLEEVATGVELAEMRVIPVQALKIWENFAAFLEYCDEQEGRFGVEEGRLVFESGEIETEFNRRFEKFGAQEELRTMLAG